LTSDNLIVIAYALQTIFQFTGYNTGKCAHFDQKARTMTPIRILYMIEDHVPGILLALMTVLVLVDVTGRYVLNISFAGSAEVATALFVWLVFLGSSGAVRKFQHIGIDGFTAFVPKVGLPWLQLAISGAIFVLSIYFVRIGFNLANASWGREIDMVGVSYFYVYIIVPISFGLMAWHSLVQIIDIVKNREDAVCLRHKNTRDLEV
jgi:TRAP-type transport system small permease protein